MLEQHQRSEQLTLDVGGEPPSVASFKISGRLACFGELPKGADVRVSIIDADGEIVASGEGFVRSIGFQLHKPKGGPDWTERVHGVKLEAAA